jgi:hypothetical protein
MDGSMSIAFMIYYDLELRPQVMSMAHFPEICSSLRIQSARDDGAEVRLSLRSLKLGDSTDLSPPLLPHQLTITPSTILVSRRQAIAQLYLHIAPVS